MISAATVGRVLAEADLRPHKVRGWLNRADDPSFWLRAGQVCCLYLNPPPGTVLISVDEKTGIQAKSRRHPEIPARPGRDARREFEYVRHGTVSILAAMNVATGEVIAERIDKNDSATFTAFLAMLHQMIPPHLRIHLIMDNGSSHTSRATQAWLAAHPRFAVTYTPKHASWLNIIEQWFSVLTRRLLRRGDFTSRDDLEAKITTFTVRHNKNARPCKWSYDADAEHARYLERHPRPETTSPSRRKPHDHNAGNRNPVRNLRFAVPGRTRRRSGGDEQGGEGLGEPVFVPHRAPPSPGHQQLVDLRAVQGPGDVGGCRCRQPGGEHPAIGKRVDEGPGVLVASVRERAVQLRQVGVHRRGDLGEERRPLVDLADDPGGPCQRPAGVGFAHGGPELGPCLHRRRLSAAGHDPVHDRFQEAALAGESRIDGRGRDPGLRGDRCHGRGRIAHPHEQVLRRIEDVGLRLLRLPLPSIRRVRASQGLNIVHAARVLL